MSPFSSLMVASALWAGWLVFATEAFIPAQPTNQSNAIQQGTNQSDTSSLQLQWFPNSSFSETISYQLPGADTTGISKGALVHFSELNLTDDITTTPWIAFVSCDFNVTGFSLDVDIFTLARDRGAVAALLYSEWSDACIINQGYLDPTIFEQIFDIFSTKSLPNARTIENSFTNVNQTLYSNFNASMLNASAAFINESSDTGVVPSPGYLFATLVAYNATMPNSSNSPSAGPGTTSPGGTKSTDLAMIVLYVITGAVSVLFCVVILSGAVRAIRHPERYGPRPADPTMGEYGTAQSRARGITRAILDTFPVIKFSAAAPGGTRGAPATNPGKPFDVEDGALYGGGANLEMSRLDTHTNAGSITTTGAQTRLISDGAFEHAELTRETSSNVDSATSSPGAGPSRSSADQADLISAQDVPRSFSPTARPQRPPMAPSETVTPATIGRETCPICIVDFEEGDDLRVLPCEGKHVFHQQCVDPWLLELSSSCPLCRHDFHALEEMISGGSQHDHEASSSTQDNRLSAIHNTSRFSRYLRFARGRRGHHLPWGNRDESFEDPTDPPYPVVREHEDSV